VNRYDLAFDPTYRREVNDKWTGLTVQYNGTLRNLRVVSAWPLPNGSVGLFLEDSDGTTLTASSDYYTIVRSKD
jgi:hypothetical protein